ncbi:MAG: hypothetical protein Q9169_001231 [Polycauliona sp. 2 TL-2023]
MDPSPLLNDREDLLPFHHPAHPPRLLQLSYLALPVYLAKSRRQNGRRSQIDRTLQRHSTRTLVTHAQRRTWSLMRIRNKGLQGSTRRLQRRYGRRCGFVAGLEIEG